MDYPVEHEMAHVANVGKLVEDMELKMRNLLREYSIRGLGMRIRQANFVQRRCISVKVRLR